jgi:hypothetical protein
MGTHYNSQIVIFQKTVMSLPVEDDMVKNRNPQRFPGFLQLPSNPRIFPGGCEIASTLEG